MSTRPDQNFKGKERSLAIETLAAGNDRNHPGSSTISTTSPLTVYSNIAIQVSVRQQLTKKEDPPCTIKDILTVYGNLMIVAIGPGAS